MVDKSRTFTKCDISNEKGRTSLLLLTRGHADVYKKVILQPEHLASFQVEE